MFLLLKLIKPAILIAALVVAYLYVPAVGSVSGKAVQRSVVGELDGSGDGGPTACRRVREGRWRCSVQRFQGDSSPRATASACATGAAGRRRSAPATTSPSPAAQPAASTSAISSRESKET